MMERLMAYLKHTPEGEIADTAELEELLAECWDEFHGDYGGMEPQKLFGRLEDVLWRPPMLEFVIERHGGTVMGSSRAKLQRWKVDIERRTVTVQPSGYRQVSPRQATLDVKPIAKEVAQLILNGKNDDRLKWHEGGRVQVLIGRILPEGSSVRQTLIGRRKRLRSEIARQLAEQGWKQIRPNWYAPDDP